MLHSLSPLDADSCGDGTSMHPEFRSRWSILLTSEKLNEGK
jgi:hypothetical protein